MHQRRGTWCEGTTPARLWSLAWFEPSSPMPVSAYWSMLALWGGLAEAEVNVEPPRHDWKDGSVSLSALRQGLELISAALAGFSRVNA